MKEKRNELWKLDLLEAKYRQVTPRFSFTKKLINARNNSHLMKKLPATPNEAFKQIEALKSELFAKKYHGSYKKLSRDVSRAAKAKQNQSKNDQHVQKILQDKDFHEQLITAKLVKIVQSAVLVTKELRASPPAYIPEDVRACILDKTSARNPSQFFIKYCQNDKVLNEYISKMWNSKDMKTLCSEIDWSFRKIRGNFTKAELAMRSRDAVVKGTSIAAGDGDSDDDASDSEDSDSEGEAGSGDEIDAEDAFEKFAAYDNMVAGSDEESEFVADPSVNYNEVTDEEMESDDAGNDSDFLSDPAAKKAQLEQEKKERKEKKEKREKKNALPQLATGYFSGGSDDEEDVDNDKVVKEATTVRKNRRGQRARQKIWEQKYGAKAVHVQKENTRLASEREQKQQEFEDRQRKRELKARLAQEKNTSKTAGSVSATATGETSKMHPSWEAKKLAEEKMKNVKFEGKKITFD